jgi:hypothetical protein
VEYGLDQEFQVEEVDFTKRVEEERQPDPVEEAPVADDIDYDAKTLEDEP